MVETEKPTWIIGSPPCTFFSAWNQGINHRKMSPERVEALRVEAVRHLHYMAGLYKLQLSAGRHFLHEHPATASSWSDPWIMRLLNHPKFRHLCRINASMVYLLRMLMDCQCPPRNQRDGCHHLPLCLIGYLGDVQAIMCTNIWLVGGPKRPKTTPLNWSLKSCVVSGPRPMLKKSGAMNARRNSLPVCALPV